MKGLCECGVVQEIKKGKRSGAFVCMYVYGHYSHNVLCCSIIHKQKPARPPASVEYSTVLMMMVLNESHGSKGYPFWYVYGMEKEHIHPSIQHQKPVSQPTSQEEEGLADCHCISCGAYVKRISEEVPTVSRWEWLNGKRFVTLFGGVATL